MTREEAFKILIVTEQFSEKEIETAYNESVNYYNTLIRDAITPKLKQKYQDELTLRKEAYMFLNTQLKSEIDTTNFVTKEAAFHESGNQNIKSSAQENNTSQKTPSAFSPPYKNSNNKLLLLGGVAIITLLIIVVYIQLSKTTLIEPIETIQPEETSTKSQATNSSISNTKAIDLDKPKLKPIHAKENKLPIDNNNYTYKINYDFTSNSKDGWEETEKPIEFINFSITGDRYLIENKYMKYGGPSISSSIPTRLNYDNNFRIETEFIILNKKGAYAGLTWGGSTNDLYFFGIDGLNRMSVVQKINSFWHPIIETKINNINKDENKLTIIKDGDQLLFGINGIIVANLSNKKIFGNRCGFLVDGGCSAAYSYLKVEGF
jgi:hypothetical protein